MITSESLDKKGNRSWRVITEPKVEPLNLQEVKDFARIDGTDEDNLLNAYIKEVRINTELYLRRALINQTIRLTMDEWNDMEIELPCPPLVSISSVKTIDEDGTETTYDSDNYYVVTESIPGKIVIKQDIEKPENLDRTVGGFRIEYIAGYGNSPLSIPESIKTGMKYWIAKMYDMREPLLEPPAEAKMYFRLFRVMRA